MTSSLFPSQKKIQRPQSLKKLSSITNTPLFPNISIEKPCFFHPAEIKQELRLPTVTARAWCITNSKTGEFLWGKASNERMEMASLTKMMTGYLSCILSERFQISLVKTTVLITKQMVMTGGTNAELKEGDRLCVQDLLYGLLLPSGNDCAMALGYFFGSYLLEKFFKGAKSRIEIGFEQSLRRFVKEMNFLAYRLALKSTSFANVHGLSNKGNKSTAEELGKMAAFVLKNQLLTEIVNTKVYNASVFNNNTNTSRMISWFNTNKLLWKGGFFGVKTGTTPNAGACLIVAYRMGETEIIVTLLACSSTKHRWEEAKILADWGYRNFIIKGAKKKRVQVKSMNSERNNIIPI